MPNRLAASTSPYLLQHQDNPVDWYPWGDEAFAAARRPRPPDPAVGRLLGLSLVPCHGSRVLRGPGDRRPHERALRQREGRPGGTSRRRRHLHGGRPGDDRSRRLADDGVPHARRRAVLRRDLLPEGSAGPACRRSARCWRRSPRPGTTGATTSTRSPTGWWRRFRSGSAPATRRSPGASCRSAYKQMIATVDGHNGGFGGAPKFPQVPALEFLLRISGAEWAPEAAGALRLTLDRMARAGSTTSSAAASPATPSTPSGWSPTSRRCSTTTPCSPASICGPGRQLGVADYLRVARETLDYMLADLGSARRRPRLGRGCRQRGGGGEVLRLRLRRVRRPGRHERSRGGGGARGDPGRQLRGRQHRARRRQPRRGGRRARRRRRVAGSGGRRRQEHVCSKPGIDESGPASTTRSSPPGTGWRSGPWPKPEPCSTRSGIWRRAAPTPGSCWRSSGGPTGDCFARTGRERRNVPGFLDDYAAYAIGLFTLYQATGEDEWFTAGLELVTRDARAVLGGTRVPLHGPRRRRADHPPPGRHGQPDPVRATRWPPRRC